MRNQRPGLRFRLRAPLISGLRSLVSSGLWSLISGRDYPKTRFIMSVHSTLTAAMLIACAATATVAGQTDLARAAKLRNPAAFNETAPATYRAQFDTSKGPFVVEVTREWAPIGADRFYNL